MSLALDRLMGGREQLLVEGLGWGSPSERLARTAVERGSDRGQILRLCLARSVPFGKYWRSRPLVFSLVPRCQTRHSAISSRSANDR